ncbi:MAG: asparagine synthase (glutamine-hydrolyzing) [Pseudomonadota bacterium]
MCGIAGVFLPSGIGWLEPREYFPMIGAIAHRGPDGLDYHVNASHTALLMHARLALVDLEGGRQPLSNSDGSVWASCNGEIYGYRETMRELSEAGHTFRTSCDSEVIPHLFEKYGTDSFVKLRGEFAFALHSERERALYLVRDRFGIKPLYYAETPEQFVFGSEIKAVLSHPAVEPRLDRRAVRSVLAGLTLPGETLFDGISEVPPGHFVRIDATGLKVVPYWSLEMDGPQAAISLDEAAAGFAERFDEAVKLRLHGDAPVGAYLSSGVDSSAVVDSMARHASGQVKAFTIRFDDARLDESPAASRVARQCGVEHQVVDVSARALADNFSASLWHSEIPVFNTHGTGKYLLSKACRGHVKAILTGEGADETLAGYAMYRHQQLLDAHRRTGSREAAVKIREMLKREGALSGLLPASTYRQKAMVEAIFGFYPYAALRALNVERLMGRVLSQELMEEFPVSDMLERMAGQLPLERLKQLDPATASRFISLKCDLPAYNLNFLGDRQEMANSIEGRLPFLDNRLADFALSLPPSVLMNEKEGKLPLRRAMAARLPNYIHQGAKKVFWAPVNALDQVLGSAACELALSREAVWDAGYFDPGRLNLLRLAAKITPPRTQAGMALRTILTCAASLHLIHDMFAVNFAASAANFMPSSARRQVEELSWRGPRGAESGNGTICS